MKKNGFTLVELLVVIVIISVLSIIVIPSIININKNINKRLLEEKKEHIESSAILYANNNEEIFNGTDEVKVFVYELINTNYLSVDVDTTDNRCSGASGDTTKGCILNPTKTGTASSMNNSYVILRKEGVGVSATFVTDDDETTAVTSSQVLVDVICAKFASGAFTGHTYNSSGSIVDCVCDKTVNATNLYIKGTTTPVDACVIAGEGVDNYLKYGDTKANWRVIGIYKNVDGNGGLSAKMITMDPI